MDDEARRASLTGRRDLKGEFLRNFLGRDMGILCASCSLVANIMGNGVRTDGGCTDVGCIGVRYYLQMHPRFASGANEQRVARILPRRECDCHERNHCIVRPAECDCGAWAVLRVRKGRGF